MAVVTECRLDAASCARLGSKFSYVYLRRPAAAASAGKQRMRWLRLAAAGILFGCVWLFLHSVAIYSTQQQPPPPPQRQQQQQQRQQTASLPGSAARAAAAQLDKLPAAAPLPALALRTPLDPAAGAQLGPLPSVSAPPGTEASACSSFAPGLRPLKWLFLQSREDERNRMEPFYRVLVEGAKSSPLVRDARHWGPGRSHWKTARTFGENIDYRFGREDFFDVVMTCGDVERYLEAIAGSRAVITARRHECRETEKCQRVLNRGKFDLAALVNPFEIATNADILASSKRMAIAHLPSPVLKSAMYRPFGAHRAQDILLVGQVNSKYPLRNIFRDMLRNQTIFGLAESVHAKVRSHPGYYGQNQDWARQFTEYCEELKSTKILLTDSAWVHYSVQKYSESVVAGALMIGDIPHDRMREYRRIMVEVPGQNVSKQHLGRVVKWWLEHTEERLAKAEAAQIWGMQNVLTDNFFYTWTELYQEMAGTPRDPSTHGGFFVGKHFPHSFYVRCRGAGGEEWCAGQEFKKGITKLPHFWRHSNDPRQHHPSFGGMVNPADTTAAAAQSCDSFEPPSYQSRWQPLRWLFLQSKDVFDHSASLVMRDLVTGAKSYAFIDDGASRLWGPGWLGYADNQSVVENVQRVYGDPEYFDLVYFEEDFVSKPAVGEELEASRTVVVTSQQSCPESLQTDHGLTCAGLLQGRNADIVAIGNAQELLTNTELHSLSTRSLLLHWPHMASPGPGGAVSDLSEAPRRIDVLLLRGAADMETATPGWLGQLGSRLVATKTFDASKLGTERPRRGHDSGAPGMSELVALLQVSKIVITDTTARRYWVPELSHALMAGALVISDLPGENKRAFRKHGVEAPSKSTAKDLRGLVSYWLEHDAERLAKVRAGQTFARRHLGSHSFFDLISESYYEVVSPPFGERLVGKKFLFPFSVQCRADGGEDYCRAQQKIEVSSGKRKGPGGGPQNNQSWQSVG
eukprot:SAG22_NODE_728_length_7596_cov_342.279178_1_plen_973_part_00